MSDLSILVHQISNHRLEVNFVYLKNPDNLSISVYKKNKQFCKIFKNTSKLALRVSSYLIRYFNIYVFLKVMNLMYFLNQELRLPAKSKLRTHYHQWYIPDWCVFSCPYMYIIEDMIKNYNIMFFLNNGLNGSELRSIRTVLVHSLFGGNQT